eukprot:Hpha_TRINITY_DN15282_c4_g3::TRINITY_DN15282_c4_g3_i1::g.66690::m.66690
MSISGIVRAWSKGYGFAQCDDGRTVFVHHKEIGHGNRLRVGAVLNFDIEENDGHDGRVKARNVSGPGIVTWAEWKKTAPTQEEREQERASWESYKRNQLGYEEGTGHPSAPAKPKIKKGDEGEEIKEDCRVVGEENKEDCRVVSSAGAATGSGSPPAPGKTKQPEAASAQPVCPQPAAVAATVPRAGKKKGKGQQQQQQQ